MELTGKAKKDFEEWFVENDKGNPIKSWISGEECIGLVYLQTPFQYHPLSIRYGVYVDWGDSVKYEIEIFKDGGLWMFNIHYSDYEPKDIKSKTRNEAQIKSIKKLNEIYNNKRHENTN